MLYLYNNLLRGDGIFMTTANSMEKKESFNEFSERQVNIMQNSEVNSPDYNCALLSLMESSDLLKMTRHNLNKFMYSNSSNYSYVVESVMNVALFDAIRTYDSAKGSFSFHLNRYLYKYAAKEAYSLPGNNFKLDDDTRKYLKKYRQLKETQDLQLLSHEQLASKLSQEFDIDNELAENLIWADLATKSVDIDKPGVDHSSAKEHNSSLTTEDKVCKNETLAYVREVLASLTEVDREVLMAYMSHLDEKNSDYGFQTKLARSMGWSSYHAGKALAKAIDAFKKSVDPSKIDGIVNI
jgi:DNA-directed RNA polymerase specialized sigma subunit